MSKESLTFLQADTTTPHKANSYNFTLEIGYKGKFVHSDRSPLGPEGVCRAQYQAYK